MTDYGALLTEMLCDVDVALGRDTSADHHGDELDFARRMHDVHVTGVGRERLLVRRRRILAALERVADGTFGHCLDCAAEIPAPRLRVNPDAETCIACALRRERAAVVGA